MARFQLYYNACNKNLHKGRKFRHHSSSVYIPKIFMKLIRLILLHTILLTLIGCQTIHLDDPWPTNMPAKDRFVQDYLSKFDSPPTDKEMEVQMSWVVKFYQGTPVYPGGWLKVSEQFVDTITEPVRKKEVAGKLEDLGIQISNEWSRANNVRLINNRNIVVWGNGLRTASERDEHELYLMKVERDVSDILGKKLLAKEIDYERYYPNRDSNEDIDDDF